jgi:hypothetical protein
MAKASDPAARPRLIVNQTYAWTDTSGAEDSVSLYGAISGDSAAIRPALERADQFVLAHSWNEGQPLTSTLTRISSLRIPAHAVPRDQVLEAFGEFAQECGFAPKALRLVDLIAAPARFDWAMSGGSAAADNIPLEARIADLAGLQQRWRFELPRYLELDTANGTGRNPELIFEFHCGLNPLAYAIAHLFIAYSFGDVRRGVELCANSIPGFEYTGLPSAQIASAFDELTATGWLDHYNPPGLGSWKSSWSAVKGPKARKILQDELLSWGRPF